MHSSSENVMKRKSSQRRLRTRAFTLMEVLMVVVILGLLAALVVPNLFGTRKGAEIDLTRAKINGSIRSSLELYRNHMGRYPTSDEGLAALVEPPDDDEEAERWRGPYITDLKDLKDAWGNELIFESPGEYNEQGYDLSSSGPDGDSGNEDDITNWDKA